MGSKEHETILYFAYGSNLWTKRIHENNPSAKMKAVGLLQDYKLEFGHMSQRWKGASANILRSTGSKVYGLLWEIAKSDLPSLDRQEGVGENIYERMEIIVEIDDGEKVSCMVYKLRDDTREEHQKQYGDNLLPSLRYKNVILRGAREHKLPAEYIAYLESIPDNGYNGEVDANIPDPSS